MVHDRHAFGVIQMPANLLETTGLAVAPAMQKAGLKVCMVCLRCQKKPFVLPSMTKRTHQDAAPTRAKFKPKRRALFDRGENDDNGWNCE